MTKNRRTITLINNYNKWKKEQQTRNELENLRETLNIHKELFHEVNKFQWKEIITKIEKHFLKQGNYKTRNTLHWCWNCGLKEESNSMCFKNYDSYKYLDLLIERKELVWFLVEERSYEKSKFWIYEGYIEPIQSILNESAYVDEYYIVSKKLHWLLVENHHGCLICSGEIMGNKMEKLKNHLQDI